MEWHCSSLLGIARRLRRIARHCLALPGVAWRCLARLRPPPIRRAPHPQQPQASPSNAGGRF
eukprot:253578-Pyramimonas_sp.AAC.1